MRHTSRRSRYFGGFTLTVIAAIAAIAATVFLTESSALAYTSGSAAAPAATRSRICPTVAAMSCVCVAVMLCTAIGLPPPIVIEPMRTSRVGFRGNARDSTPVSLCHLSTRERGDPDLRLNDCGTE